jgi:hypothetical protein
LDAFKVPGSVFDTAIADHGVHAQNHVIRPYVLATRAWRHDDEINSTSDPAIVRFNFIFNTLWTILCVHVFTTLMLQSHASLQLTFCLLAARYILSVTTMHTRLRCTHVTDRDAYTNIIMQTCIAYLLLLRTIHT